MCESFTVAILLLLMYDVNDLTITMNTKALGSSCLTCFPPTTGIYLPLDVSGALSWCIVTQHWSCGLPVENPMCINRKINPLNYRDNSYVVMKLQFNSTSLQGEKIASCIQGALSLPLLSNVFNSLKCFEVPLREKMRYKTLALLYACNIAGISVILWKITLSCFSLTYCFAHNVLVFLPQR